MKKSVHLSIPETCAENWNNFEPVTGGAFCQSCCKTVVDFTQMSDSELIDYFQNRTEKTCGKFRSTQLRAYAFNTPTHVKPGFHAIKVGLLGMLLTITTSPARAHNQPISTALQWLNVSKSLPESVSTHGLEFTVRGTVVDESGQPAPGVHVLLKGTPHGTTTDLEGRFEFSGLRNGDVLIFSFIGYESVQYTVSEKNRDGDVSIQIKMEYAVMMGAVAVDDVYEPKPESRMKRFWNKVKEIF